MRSVSLETLGRRLRAIVEVDVSEEFGALKPPVLYISGTRDRLVPPKVTTQLRAIRPDMDVCHLEAPHFVLQRSPAAAAAAISRFLRRLD